MKKFELVLEALSNLKTVGTVTFSSPALVKKILKPIDFEKAKIIVEFGAGDGCITKKILESMSPDAKLLSFEVNDKFIESLKSISDPRLILIHDSAEKLSHYLHAHGHEKADAVISSIPISLMDDSTTQNIMDEIKSTLAVYGKFIQLQYSLVSKKLYERNFASVDYDFFLLNLPPAFVYVCLPVAA